MVSNVFQTIIAEKCLVFSSSNIPSDLVRAIFPAFDADSILLL